MKRLFNLVLLATMALHLSATPISFSMETEAASKNTPDGWTEVQLPTGIPEITDENTFVITDAPYSASTNSADNTAAIQAALDAAAAAGGGMVVIPEGTFLSGALTMGSKTILHLCENATLKLLPISTFSTDGNGYHKMENPFISGKSGASDIVIEGESRETSIIDGQGAPWWDEVEAAKAESKSTTRSALIRFWQGERYLFRNFRIQNAPNTNITIGRNGTGAHATAHAITIKNPASHDVDDPSHNTDGFPIWTQYVNIYDCEIDTGDDNIVCDQNAQFVHVWNCDLKAGHGASFGSYTTNMHDIIYENLTLTNTDAGFRLKSNNDRSGDVYNIVFRNCTLNNVLSPISITCWYDSLPNPATVAKQDSTEKTPAFHGITIKDVTISGCKTTTASPKNGYGIFIYGRPESFVRDVTFDNVNINHTKGLKLNYCDGIKFKNCAITVGDVSSTDDNLPASLIEQKYNGSYTWETIQGEDASLAWLIGNEAAATVTSEVDTYISKTKVTTGTGLTLGTKSDYAANPGNTMVTYQPATSNAGPEASVMIEYSIEMKKGATFKLSGVSYDAIKDGTDNATYSWSYTVDGVESAITTVSKDNLLRNNNTTGVPALRHSETVSATAGQKVTVRFYVSGFANNKKFALSNLQINGSILGEPIARAFTDFKIEFRDNPYTVLLPANGQLPDGVTIEGTGYNGGQHGIYGGTITVPVDGAVKFTLGACQYSGTDIAVKKNGTAFTTISNNAPCGEQKPNYNQFVTWTYNSEEAATLTFELAGNTYLPYLFAEATDYVAQVEVRYYDADGKTFIGSEKVENGSALAYAYTADDVTIPEGHAFRGWFNAADPTAAKVPAGTIVSEDMNLYARTSAVEVATEGSIFSYDLTKTYFYPEDHELISFTKGAFHDAQHGWSFSSNGTVTIQVAGNALVQFSLCQYGNAGTLSCVDGASQPVGEAITLPVASDGNPGVFSYSGAATTLTFTLSKGGYIHSIKVYNVKELPAKNDAGYYVLSANDGAALLLTLEMAQAGDKIFLPDGTYDFGETVLTAISKNDIAIIGQSEQGTVIRNAPDYHNESINNTATLYVLKDVSGTYLQDLTIQNALDYYKAIAALNNGRAVCLWDKGTKTICKNVRLLSYQDTYYSNLQGALKYFEDCEIHGTVDYICGDGTVYFKNNILYCEKRALNGGGSDAITANNGLASEGYVFEGCTILSECPTVSLGRAWNNTPTTIFLNSLVDDSAGEFSFTGNGIQRWTKELMNANAWPVFGEYNTRSLEDDAELTPASNKVTFVDNKSGGATKAIETVLTAEQAANYSYAKVFGANWDPAAEAQQATADPQSIDSDAAYLVEDKEGVFVAIEKGDALTAHVGKYIRKANTRGGFGAKVLYTTDPTALDNANANAKATKRIENGMIIIEKAGVKYNVLGQMMR